MSRKYAHLRPTPTLRATRIAVPGDKSLSHRALMLAAIATGPSILRGLLRADDIAATRGALAALGAQIMDAADGSVIVSGGLAQAQTSPGSPVPLLHCHNSGTSMRLLLGLVAGLGRPATLLGDASLSRRPMGRIIAPLRAMGAHIAGGPQAPLHHEGRAQLTGCEHRLLIASGQLKGALLLAGLFAQGPTRLTGALGGRDHTERLLRHFGVTLSSTPTDIVLMGPQRLVGRSLRIPADISSAAFWLAAAAICPGSCIALENVGLNPTRMGFVRLLRRMGARLRIEHAPATAPHDEPYGSIEASYAPLHGTQIDAQDVPHLIDELPLVAVLATQARGRTVVRGAGELRHKESDRLAAICAGLGAMGIVVQLFDDGFLIEGPQPLRGAHVDAHADHRIAMALSIAALRADADTFVHGSACVDVSYPAFYSHLAALAGYPERILAE